MQENETNVSPEATSPEPSKTAENVTLTSAPGASAGGAGESSPETNVTVARRIIAEVQELVAQLRAECDRKILQAKAEILEHIAALVTPLVAKSAEAVTPSAAPSQPAADAASRVGPTRGVMLEELPHVIAVGDPVKVWADPEHRYFALGVVHAVHGDGDAYDVELEDGAVSKIPADGLEFDERR